MQKMRKNYIVIIQSYKKSGITTYCRHRLPVHFTKPSKKPVILRLMQTSPNSFCHCEINPQSPKNILFPGNHGSTT
jgi:hypothetical protein